MKQLIAGLVLGLGLLQGAQADAQSQTFDFTIPADGSLGYTSGIKLGSFDSNLGTLTGFEWGYSLYAPFDYTITNNSSTTTNAVVLSAQGGSLDVEFDKSGLTLATYSIPFSGSTSLNLAPGATVTDTLYAVAKGQNQLPNFPGLAQLIEGSVVNLSVNLPSFSLAARSFNKLSVDANSGDMVGTAYFNYVYDAAPVPEPENYAMLLAGLCLIGVMVSRSKVQ